MMMMTIKLLQKDYMYLADRSIPLGEVQANMSRHEIADMLRTKTRRFSEDEIQRKFKRSTRQMECRGWDSCPICTPTKGELRDPG